MAGTSVGFRSLWSIAARRRTNIWISRPRRCSRSQRAGGRGLISGSSPSAFAAYIACNAADHLHPKPVEDLRHRFQALKGVDLEIRRGEIFALLDPTARQDHADRYRLRHRQSSAGSVTVDGHDIIRDYRAARAQIGWCRRRS